MIDALITGFEGHEPKVAPDAFVAPTAVLIGRVRLGARSNVWYGSVLRGDDDNIVLGEDCNVQDACVLHADADYPVLLGDRVSLGHGAIVHGCSIDDDVLIGIRAVVLNDCHIGSWSLVAAGAVVTPGTKVPEGSLVAGVPAKVMRPVGHKEKDMIASTPRSYVEKLQEHRAILEA